MSHRTKKTEEKRKHRGSTFVGFAPRVEDTKREKIRKAERKHKKRFAFQLAPGPQTFLKKF